MWETLLTLFVFGGFWFWALAIVASCFVIAALEHEEEGFATFFVLVSFGLIFFLGNSYLFDWILSNPWKLLLFITSYFGVGTGYSIVKWYLKVQNAAQEYAEKRTLWLEAKIKVAMDQGDDEKALLYDDALQHGLAGNRAVLEEWRKHVKGVAYGEPFVKPIASENKSRIMGWIAYWPWSGLWTLINDPFRKICTFLYQRIKGFLQDIADKIYADIDKELDR